MRMRPETTVHCQREPVFLADKREDPSDLLPLTIEDGQENTLLEVLLEVLLDLITSTRTTIHHTIITTSLLRGGPYHTRYSVSLTLTLVSTTAV